jgi:hypothetical protein
MRKQELRRGTAAYNLAKAQGRLPAKSKSTKKTGNPLSRLMGALTGKPKPKPKVAPQPKKTRAQGTTGPKVTTTTAGKNVSGGTRGQKNKNKVSPSAKPKNKPNSRVAGRKKGGPQVTSKAKTEKPKSRFKRGKRK